MRPLDNRQRLVHQLADWHLQRARNVSGKGAQNVAFGDDAGFGCRQIILNWRWSNHAGVPTRSGCSW
jgi:hypothetical protein